MAVTLDFSQQIADIRAHSQSYQVDPAFLRVWGGLSQVDAEYRTAQESVFVRLIGSVTETLAAWKILDVGCGSGRWLRWYLELGARPKHIVGIDVSDVRFQEGQSINPLVKMVQLDGINIPFSDKSFDLVTQWVCFSCIPSIELRQRTADEMVRVLKPGGYIFWWDLPNTVAPSAPPPSGSIPRIISTICIFEKSGLGVIPGPANASRDAGGRSFLDGWLTLLRFAPLTLLP
jgi:SAM-dependent methyltransferase